MKIRSSSKLTFVAVASRATAKHATSFIVAFSLRLRYNNAGDDNGQTTAATLTSATDAAAAAAARSIH